MKLVQAGRDDLLQPLQAVSGIVEKRHTLPILSNVLFERIGERLHLLATDLEIQVSTSFTTPQKGGENYPVTASAPQLQESFRALPEEAEITWRHRITACWCAREKPVYAADVARRRLPKLAATGGAAAKFKIAQKELKSLFLLVQYAMAQQDIRYYLNGMWWCWTQRCSRPWLPMGTGSPMRARNCSKNRICRRLSCRVRQCGNRKAVER